MVAWVVYGSTAHLAGVGQMEGVPEGLASVGQMEGVARVGQMEEEMEGQTNTMCLVSASVASLFSVSVGSSTTAG